MELNAEGFYKKPRVVSGFKFLAHITETRKCGNRMPVHFPARGTIDVIDYRLNPNDRFDCSVLFLAPLGKDDVWVEDIEEWEFVQYRPNTQWTAIELEKKEDDVDFETPERIPASTYFKMLLNSIYGKNCFCVMIEGGEGYAFVATGVEIRDNSAFISVAPNDEDVARVVYSDIDTLEFEFIPGIDGKPGYYRSIRKELAVKDEKKLSPIDFQDYYIKETFDNLHEVVVLYDAQFYTLIGMIQNLAKPGNYYIYLKRFMYDCIRKVEVNSKQVFEYQKNSNSWLIEPTEVLYTEINDIKEQLRSDDAVWVYVSGVKKKLKRFSEISANLLHFVFVNGDQIEHFYSTKKVRLRVRDGKLGTEYLLDHVKRMHV